MNDLNICKCFFDSIYFFVYLFKLMPILSYSDCEIYLVIDICSIIYYID